MHSKNPDVRACWQKLAIIAPKNEVTYVGYRKIIYDKHFSQGVCLWRGKCMFQENTWWINTVYSRTKPKFIYLINKYISFREVQNLTRTNLAWNANLKKKTSSKYKIIFCDTSKNVGCYTRVFTFLSKSSARLWITMTSSSICTVVFSLVEPRPSIKGNIRQKKLHFRVLQFYFRL